ncbi:MAG: helical backbone metal receptor, partial [Desulfurococcaceae archaeon]
YCDYPPEVQQLKNNGSLAIIGGFWDPNVELILSVKPDLVIGYSSVPSHIEVAERLEAMGVNVLLLFPRYLNDVLNNVELIGKATGRLEEARMLVYSMKERVNAITLKVKELEKVRVYYELWFAPLMSAGPGTFIDELITLARGENIFHDSGTSWPLVKDEDVITRDPQVIILPTTYMSDYNVTVDQIKSREGWSMISAVKDDRIYFVQEDLLVRPGPRMVDGLEALAEIIHPEAFKR